jgi:4-hydroxy-tetrahydrodipicolinate reductase
MRIALIGYGKMGKIIEQTARAQGHTIATIVDKFVTEAPAAMQVSKTIEEANPDPSYVDAAFEFSFPEEAAGNIIALAERKIPVVSGTTGWHNRIAEVTREVEKEGTSLLWASNFSIGVNLFYRMAWYGAQLVNNFGEYDTGGLEIHHNKKLDSPSGTAKTLAEGVLSRIDRKKKIVWETINRKPDEDELHFPSMRLGSVPGQHSLFFDSPADTIEITHTVRNREDFALGAVQAAKWLTAEKRRGVFTFDDMLKDILKI